MNDKPNDAELKKFRSWMAGAFYQSWDLDEEDGMVGVVEKEFCHSIEASEEVVEHIDRLISASADQTDPSAFLSGFTGDYDPSDDGLHVIEWFTLLKSYLKGKKDVFDKIT